MGKRARNTVMADERLGKRKPRHEVRHGTERDARLLAVPKRLIEAKQHGLRRILGMEPPLEARARQIVVLADALQAQPPQEKRDLRFKTQGLDGKGMKRIPDLSVSHDDGRAGAIAGKRVGPSTCLGQSKPCAKPRARKPRSHVGKERRLPAEEMRNARNIEPEPVIGISIECRAIAGRGPAREGEKGVLVLLGGGRRSQKMRADGPGIGKTEPLSKTFAEACLIDGGEKEPALLAAHKGERPVIR
jgi:hypothetical protein